MDSMYCYSCVLKHLAAALSFAKEIISGHTYGADLDHRVDFLGELSNAEQHLELIDAGLFAKVSAFRKMVQEKANIPDMADLTEIRRFFAEAEQLSGNIPAKTEAVPSRNYEKSLDIVFPKISNFADFQFIYESIRKKGINCGKMFYLESTLDLSGFELKKISSYSADDLSEDFIIWPEKVCLKGKFDLQKIFPAYSYPAGTHDFRSILPKINAEKEKPLLFYDGTVPQPVNRKEFLAAMEGVDTEYPLTLYFNRMGTGRDRNASQIFVKVEKEICCSVKSKLRSALYAGWTDEGFPYLKKYLEENQ